MSSTVKMILFGVGVWLIPFAAGFVLFPLQESAMAAFDSLMAVAVAGGTAWLGLRWLRAPGPGTAYPPLVAGIVWMLICIAIDLPVFAGMMGMTAVEYFGDIALTYLIVPIVLVGLAAAQAGNADSQGD